VLAFEYIQWLGKERNITSTKTLVICFLMQVSLCLHCVLCCLTADSSSSSSTNFALHWSLIVLVDQKAGCLRLHPSSSAPSPSPPSFCSRSLFALLLSLCTPCCVLLQGSVHKLSLVWLVFEQSVNILQAAYIARAASRADTVQRRAGQVGDPAWPRSLQDWQGLRGTANHGSGSSHVPRVGGVSGRMEKRAESST
jgi:hypothetical protein